MSQRERFLAGSDDDLGDFRKLVEAWPAGERATTRDLLAVCEAQGCFPAQVDRATERGKLTALGRALQRYRGRSWDGMRMVVEGTGSERWYRLERVGG
jgi:hypothetical protein